MNVSYMEYSTYVNGSKRADVVRSVGDPTNRTWGVRYSIGEDNYGIEWYDGKSESFAESAAENFVEGIKTTVNNHIVKS